MKFTLNTEPYTFFTHQTVNGYVIAVKYEPTGITQPLRESVNLDIKFPEDYSYYFRFKANAEDMLKKVAAINDFTEIINC